MFPTTTLLCFGWVCILILSTIRFWNFFGDKLGALTWFFFHNMCNILWGHSIHFEYNWQFFLKCIFVRKINHRQWSIIEYRNCFNDGIIRQESMIIFFRDYKARILTALFVFWHQWCLYYTTIKGWQRRIWQVCIN